MASGVPAGVPGGPGPAGRRGTDDRHAAGRREGRRPVVGLVGGEDRRRVAARHRRGGLRPADRLAAGLRSARAGPAGRAAGHRADRRGVRAPPRRRDGQGPGRGHARRPDRLSPAPAPPERQAGPDRVPRRRGAGGGTDAGHHPRASVRRRRLGRPGRARRGGRRAAGTAPGHPALAVRLPDLGPEAHAAPVRLRAQPRGLRAQGQAGPRLLRDAAARRRAPGRPGRPGPPRHDADRPPGLPRPPVGRRTDGPRPPRSRHLGRLRQRGTRPGRTGSGRTAPQVRC